MQATQESGPSGPAGGCSCFPQAAHDSPGGAPIAARCACASMEEVVTKERKRSRRDLLAVAGLLLLLATVMLAFLRL